MSDITGPHKRAYDFVAHLKELEDIYQVEIELGDFCIVIFESGTRKQLATLYEDELHLEYGEEVDH